MGDKVPIINYEPDEESKYTRDVTGVKFFIRLSIWKEPTKNIFRLKKLNHGTAAALEIGRMLYFGKHRLIIMNVAAEVEKDDRKGEGSLLVELAIPGVTGKEEIEKRLITEGWNIE